ncbi:uncharacterized protein LOC143596706 [Bidens hawaiensis]|uniref:uncharacterized protein LOC143596706 n=1 Tax=Bidens hawaiensis TaxID=980011 RepID=UPI0040498D1E
MAVVDNRIINRQDALLGAVQGNLAYGKFMFIVYPKFALHRDSKDFDKTLSFIHQCERTDLMEPGNKVFTINYLISYAITNNTHSIEYKEKESITIEDIFSDIGTVEESKFTKPSQLHENWVLHQTPRVNGYVEVFEIYENMIDFLAAQLARLANCMDGAFD